MKRGDLVTVSAQGDYGKSRSAVVAQFDALDAADQTKAYGLRYSRISSATLDMINAVTWPSFSALEASMVAIFTGRMTLGAGKPTS